MNTRYSLFTQLEGMNVAFGLVLAIEVVASNFVVCQRSAWSSDESPRTQPINARAISENQQSESAPDWPQWRGPNRDGVWRDVNILREFAASSIAPKWAAKIGPGFAGPAVTGGRVFVTDRQAERNTERVLAFDEHAGKEVWVHEYPAVYKDVDYASGPRATPTVDGDRVYTKGSMGHLHCLDVAGGHVIWSIDLVAQYNTRVPTWGMAGAPLIDGDSLIVNVGGLPGAGLVAFDKLTGEEKWRALDDRPGYAPPVIIDAGGTRQLIFWSAEAVNSLNPATGALYWKIPFRDRADMTISTPLMFRDYLFVSSYFSGSMMLKLADNRPAASVVWKDGRDEDNWKLALCISTPLFKGEHLYAIDRDGSLRCLEPATGRIVWTSTVTTGGKEHGNAHITPHGDREFLFNEYGELALTRLAADGYHELGRAKLISPSKGINDQRPVTWSHPAYANKHIFVRNDEELRCVSLAAAGHTNSPSP